MRFAAFILLFVAGIFGGTSVVEEANNAYHTKDPVKAIAKFKEALTIPDYEGQQQMLRYNIGQSYFIADSVDLPPPDSSLMRDQDPKLPPMPTHHIYALDFFRQATVGQDDVLKSLSWNDIGVILALNNRIEPALEAFKSAMRLYHDNEEARYNYELLKKRQQQQQEQEKQDQENEEEKQDQEEQKDEQQQDQQNQDQQENQDQKDQDQQDQENQDQQDQQDQQENEKEEKDAQDSQKESQQRRDTETNGEPQEIREIPMDQAKMLLEAMNENEKKFLQQLRKKPKVRTAPDDGPDW